MLGLPLDEDGAEVGDELGIVGMDGVCVDVVAEQPASPSAQAKGQTKAWT